eukprot:4829206-Pyramimonas_sp.AAC.1
MATTAGPNRMYVLAQGDDRARPHASAWRRANQTSLLEYWGPALARGNMLIQGNSAYRTLCSRPTAPSGILALLFYITYCSTRTLGLRHWLSTYTYVEYMFYVARHVQHILVARALLQHDRRHLRDIPLTNPSADARTRSLRSIVLPWKHQCG